MAICAVKTFVRMLFLKTLSVSTLSEYTQQLHWFQRPTYNFVPFGATFMKNLLSISLEYVTVLCQHKRDGATKFHPNK